MSSVVTLEKIVALCKRRGFVYPSAEIYSGINGVYDFGPLGTQLKRALKQAWRDHMNSFEQAIVEIDGHCLDRQQPGTRQVTSIILVTL